ncbi:terminase small subunit [uncultured Deinococcus sp.]|uniref:terminase small subunit n=1 Tax=uncultured Deinococcus sp. TaxID=158789 RepID=UPI0025F7C752|nr:terminase small subunit [uncultured Deinococcus sp.]
MTQPDAPQPKTAEELGAALTDKHKIFADLYLTNGLNPVAAAVACGYKGPKEGWRLRERPDVAAYISARLDEAGFSRGEILRRLEYLAASDMRDFLRVAPSERSYWIRADQSEEVREAAKRRGTTADALDNYDISSIVGSENVAMTEDGVLMVCIRKVDAEVSIDWRGAEQAQALGRVKKLKIGKDGAVEFELHDPSRNLELLGKAQKLFVDRTEHSGPNGEPLKLYANVRLDDV